MYTAADWVKDKGKTNKSRTFNKEMVKRYEAINTKEKAQEKKWPS